MSNPVRPGYRHRAPGILLQCQGPCIPVVDRFRFTGAAVCGAYLRCQPRGNPYILDARGLCLYTERGSAPEQHCSGDQ